MRIKFLNLNLTKLLQTIINVKKFKNIFEISLLMHIVVERGSRNAAENNQLTVDSFLV